MEICKNKLLILQILKSRTSSEHTFLMTGPHYLLSGEKPTAAMLSGQVLVRLVPNGVCSGDVGLRSRAASTMGNWKPVVTLVGEPTIVGSEDGPGKWGEVILGGVKPGSRPNNIESSTQHLELNKAKAWLA